MSLSPGMGVLYQTHGSTFEALSTQTIGFVPIITSQPIVGSGHPCLGRLSAYLGQRDGRSDTALKEARRTPMKTILSCAISWAVLMNPLGARADNETPSYPVGRASSDARIRPSQDPARDEAISPLAAQPDAG